MNQPATPVHALPHVAPAAPALDMDPPPLAASAAPKIVTSDLCAWIGVNAVLKDVTLAFAAGHLTAIIGPSGCGKSTLIRCLNRMHEVTPGGRVTGQVLLDGEDIYGREVNPVQIRRRVGMLFQKPNPFPTMSVRDNVLAGLRLGRGIPNDADALVEHALRQVALWDEVKDRLGRAGTSLSGGQQQRLCLARALALEPEVLLLDEPCSALDPIATAKIEDLLHGLRSRYTLVMVTHNLQQAARVADFTAFLYLGELVEFNRTATLFTRPASSRTEEYLTGRFG